MVNVPDATRKTQVDASAFSAKPIRLVVRRGALRRYDALKEKTSHLQVLVSWDRREQERRRRGYSTVDVEQRRGERRGEPRPTWDLADFTVVFEPLPPA